jgi:hypothetical protein
MTNGLLLVWYFHQPTVVGDDEVLETWHHSLEPLLRLHSETGAIANLAITGALLRRLELVHPSAIDRLARAIQDRVCELMATFYYEVAPPLLSPSSLRRQLEADMAIKSRLLCRPRSFLPGNFGWTPILARELTKLGVTSVVLDDGHLKAATAAQTWTWGRDFASMTTRMIEVPLSSAERHSTFRHDAGGAPLIAVFRDWNWVSRISHGSSGALHAPWEPAIKQAAGELCAVAADGLITLCDDGDRINPISLSAYETLLTACAGMTRSCAQLDLAGAKPLAYLPAFLLGEEEGFWGSDADSKTYLLLLAEAWRRSEAGGFSAEALLELEDVFPLFWRNVARKQWYFDRLSQLLQYP